MEPETNPSLHDNILTYLQKYRTIALAALLFLLPAGVAEASPPLESQPLAPLTACGLSKVPSGHVVTQIKSTAACSPYFAYTTAVPSDGVVMCTVTPLPSGGWVVTSISNPTTCSAGMGSPSYYGYKLYQPYSGVVMCKVPDSSIPYGWVVTSISNPTACGGGNGSGPSYFGYKLTQPSLGLVMCSVPGYAVPDGWVITEIISASNICTAGNTSPVYKGRKLALPALNLVVCADSPIPFGWAKGAKVSTSKCGGLVGYKLKVQ